MFVAAMAHRSVFSYKDYKRALTDRLEFSFSKAVCHSFDNRILLAQGVDFVRDVDAVRYLEDGTRAVRENKSQNGPHDASKREPKNGENKSHGPYLDFMFEPPCDVLADLKPRF